MEFHIPSQGNRQLRTAEKWEALLPFWKKPSCRGPGPLEGGSGWLGVHEHCLWVRRQLWVLPLRIVLRNTDPPNMRSLVTKGVEREG